MLIPVAMIREVFIQFNSFACSNQLSNFPNKRIFPLLNNFPILFRIFCFTPTATNLNILKLWEIQYNEAFPQWTDTLERHPMRVCCRQGKYQECPR